MIFLTLFVASTLAHNFLSSPSRSRFANTLHPCLPRTSAMPHVAVGKNDEFQVEFVTGHGRTGYFAMVEAKDEHLLKDMTWEMIDEYISGAPNGEGSKLPARKWRKFHRKNLETWDDDLLDNHYKNNKNVVKKYPDWYKAEVPDTDPLFMKRPQRFGPELKMLEFKDDQQKDDRSVAYQSNKFPHILLAKKFSYSALQPYRNDVARFKVPDGVDSGNLVIWWYWSGYRDCVDVLFNATKTTPSSEDAIYGVPSEQTTWERIDHCNFPDYKSIRSSCIDFVSTPETCLSTCGSEHGCLGAVVAPVIVPDSVPARFRDLGMNGALPWGATSSGHYKTANYTCDPSKFTHATKDTYACVAFEPRAASETYEEFEITNDPMSPYFYSTCYFKRRQVKFESVPPPQASPDIAWRTANKDCLSCQNTVDFAARDNRVLFGHKDKYEVDWLIPKWERPEHCVNCDTEAPPVPNKFELFDPVKMAELVPNVKAETTCDGMFVEWASKTIWEYRDGGSDTCGGPQNCYKTVKLPGQSLAEENGQRQMFVYRCNYAVFHDPECSDQAVLHGTYHRQCMCRLKKACCGSCKETRDRYSHVWTAKKVW